MRLLAALRGVSDIEVFNPLDLQIKSIEENSRYVDKGSIFTVLQGANYDGSDFVSDARNRGCRVFLCGRKIDISLNETLIFSKNPRKTMAELSRAIYFDGINDMTIFGITGTKGKSTTAKMIQECLKEIGLPSVMIGTLGVIYKLVKGKPFMTENTTPSSPVIYKTLREAYDAGARAAVLEVSSQALVSYRVFGIPFTVCIFTNLSPDHIGRYEHESFEKYTEAKLSLFKSYGAKLVVINSDSKYGALFADAAKGSGARAVTVSEKSGADFRFKLISSDLTSVRFSVSDAEFFMNIGGGHNASNCALALAAVSSVTKTPLKAFKSAFENIDIPGRFRVYDKDGVKIIIDFAHNPDSLRVICEEVRKFIAGRLLVLFGSVGGRSQMRRRSLGLAAEKYADFSYITSDNPGFEDPEKICNEIYSAFKDKSKAVVICDREAAIKTAVSRASEGDFILLLGKGHENYQEIGSVKLPFSEQDIIISLGASRTE